MLDYPDVTPKADSPKLYAVNLNPKPQAMNPNPHAIPKPPLNSKP